ncbi:MAG: TIGR01906 family membrane protein [Clostridiales Family XIII bacterium]|jgi:integral membrane protein (TIGR01906 family)|nr:TIGR01906 family membrane protein [Clostridiales Family XIII bacterium]
MNKEKRFTVSNIMAAILLTVLLLSFAAVFTLNFRPLYYATVDLFGIPAASGLSAEEIRMNYDALISYNSIFAQGPLTFPTLPMSETGRIHFAEVKRIFVLTQALLIASSVCAAPICAYKLRRKQTSFLKLGAACSLVLPLVIGALIAAGWDRFFIAFHELFFDNGFWIFDSRTDPVINLLPDTFFLLCAAMILLVTIAGSAALYLIGRRLDRRRSREKSAARA